MEKNVDLKTILNENPNIEVDELLKLKPKEYGINEIENALEAKYGERFLLSSSFHAKSRDFFHN